MPHHEYGYEEFLKSFFVENMCVIASLCHNTFALSETNTLPNEMIHIVIHTIQSDSIIPEEHKCIVELYLKQNENLLTLNKWKEREHKQLD